jgi:predicted deacylase
LKATADLELDVAAGTRERRVLPIPVGVDGALELPLLVARGAQPGPTALVLGGVHGDEPEGIGAASACWHDIDPRALRGTLLVLPQANLPAWRAGTRVSGIDGLNLARSFPGRPDGTATERIAHEISGLIRTVDVLIDLHSAGLHYAMPFLAGAYAADDRLGQRCTAAALAFGAPVFWAHPEIAAGRSLSVAVEHGVVNLYAECGGGGRVRRGHYDAYRLGVQRVLGACGLLSSLPAPPPPELRLRSTGDLDTWLTAEVAGLLLERVGLLDRVSAGDVLATIVDPGDGSVLQRLEAPFDGVVVMLRRTAHVDVGDGLCMIALPEDG